MSSALPLVAALTALIVPAPGLAAQTPATPQPFASLTGTVIDAETGAPIVGARVQLFGPILDNGSNVPRKETSSDEEGRFSIGWIEPGPYSLSVTAEE